MDSTKIYHHGGAAREDDGLEILGYEGEGDNRVYMYYERTDIVVETRWGFDWHKARVERTASTRRGHCVVSIRSTDDDYANQVSIQVSPGGKSIRVFRGGKELK